MILYSDIIIALLQTKSHPVIIVIRNMPRRPSPGSLKSKCLTAVAKNLELLSYGCAKGSPELRNLIDTEDFIRIKGG